ncbi:hypothetical protein ACFLZY_02165 [Patescibacteria group bacterium]
MVVIAILTNLNIFFFVSAPAFAICDAMIGENCQAVFASVFMFGG